MHDCKCYDMQKIPTMQVGQSEPDLCFHALTVALNLCQVYSEQPAENCQY